MEKKEVIKDGFSFGTVLAIVISFTTNKSLRVLAPDFFALV